MRYFEIGFGNKNDVGFRTGDYEDLYSMAIKGEREPNTFEEAEEFLKEDMKRLGYTGINSITEIEEWECHKFFDDSNFDNWLVFK